jgi:hypothetical protein
LDGEGNPICANCMHNCSICNLPITDFAMMYGKHPPIHLFLGRSIDDVGYRQGNVP